MILTREQRVALKRVFDRHTLYRHVDTKLPHGIVCKDTPSPFVATYRQFRRTAIIPGYDVCVMVPWSGMWLGIEPDGYTHS